MTTCCIVVTNGLRWQGALVSRVLVSAHSLPDLKAALEGTEIEVIEPVERKVRALQALALTSVPSNGDAQ